MCDVTGYQHRRLTKEKIREPSQSKVKEREVAVGGAIPRLLTSQMQKIRADIAVSAPLLTS